MAKFRMAAVAAATLALAAAPALAQDVAQHGYTRADVAQFSGTPDTLIRMIQTIESSTGGRVLEIRFTTRDGAPGFRAAVEQGGHVSFLRVSIDGTGQAVLTDTDLPEWMMSWRNRADIKAANHASVPLDKAIRTAEQATRGAPAVAAGIAGSASDSDVKAYNVLVQMNDGGVRRIAVDSQTGQVIADPQALASWP